MVVHPNGRFLYGSNRGHDSIAVFTVDQDSGELDLVKTTDGCQVPFFARMIAPQ